MGRPGALEHAGNDLLHAKEIERSQPVALRELQGVRQFVAHQGPGKAEDQPANGIRFPGVFDARNDRHVPHERLGHFNGMRAGRRLAQQRGPDEMPRLRFIGVQDGIRNAHQVSDITPQGQKAGDFLL